MMSTSTDRARSARRWRVVVRVLQVVFALTVAFAVWTIGFASGDDTAAVLPDTDIQFSLDLEVVDTYDSDVVFVVEQRARPAYRIFAFDPTTGSAETIFTVPENAIIYGIALSHDESTLAVTYTPDYRIAGNGLWTLDLTTPSDEGGEAQLTEIVGVSEDVYLADPTWSADDGRVFATRVDRTGDVEQLAVAEITLDTGDSTVVADDAISPVVVDGSVYFLDVDENNARRSIGTLGTDGQRRSIVVGDGTLDLDHLIAGDDDSRLLVSAIASDDTSWITVGQPADAHGNHDVPSAWWTVPLDGGAAQPLGTEEDVTYDAAPSDEVIVSATLEGLSFTSPSTSASTPLIESRALRFVAG